MPFQAWLHYNHLFSTPAELMLFLCLRTEEEDGPSEAGWQSTKESRRCPLSFAQLPVQLRIDAKLAWQTYRY